MTQTKELVQKALRDKPAGSFHWLDMDVEFENIVDAQELERLNPDTLPDITSCVFCGEKIAVFSNAMVVLPVLISPEGLMSRNKAEEDGQASGMVFCSSKCIFDCYSEIRTNCAALAEGTKNESNLHTYPH